MRPLLLILEYFHYPQKETQRSLAVTLLNIHANVIIQYMIFGGGLVAKSDSCDLMGCSPPGSSVHGIFQARILKWAAISYSRRVTGEAPGNGCSVTLRPGVRVPTMCG